MNIPKFEQEYLVLSFNTNEARDSSGKWIGNTVKEIGKRIQKGQLTERGPKSFIKNKHFHPEGKKVANILKVKFKNIEKKKNLSNNLMRLLNSRMLRKAKKKLIAKTITKYALKGKFFNIGGMSH